LHECISYTGASLQWWTGKRQDIQLRVPNLGSENSRPSPQSAEQHTLRGGIVTTSLRFPVVVVCAHVKISTSLEKVNGEKKEKTVTF